MPQRTLRNQVVAGTFVLLMAAAAVVLLVLVGGWQSWFEETQPLRIRFETAPNIKVGGQVLMAGHPIGRVTDVRVVEVPCKPETKGMCYQVEVVGQIPTRFTIYQNARIVITQSLMGQSVVNIEEVGFDKKAAGPIQGEQASPFAAAAGELGIGEEEKKGIKEILRDFRDIAAKAKESLPDTLDKLKTTSANLAETSEKAKGAVAKVNAILDENRDNLKKTITHASSLAEKADKGADEILTNARAASADLKVAVADFKIVAADSKALLALNKGGLGQTIQNFNETSEHLKALAKEVRRAPWRLFAKPDKEEVESLNLYDVARAFASAATDLETLADTLQTMVEAKKDGVAVDQEMLDGMQKRLEETFARYQAAEAALWKEFERIQK
jgi:ABC-type transporter Mla subunit MlaD